MPPAFVNVGAYVGVGTMIDSHALVGSCAQIGARVHLSAAVQVGGVLEPVGAMPVIVEDDAFVGGGCGLYEGTRVGAGAVAGSRRRSDAGGRPPRRRCTSARSSLRLRRRSRSPNAPSWFPAAVRPARLARDRGLSLYAPVIVKYRDAGTDASAGARGGAAMSFRVARRMDGVERTLIRRIFDAAPPGSINLGLGQPDLPTPSRISLAGIDGIVSGKTGYTGRRAIPRSGPRSPRAIPDSRQGREASSSRSALRRPCSSR